MCVVDDPGIRVRDIATTVGITERAAQRIVSELVEGGYVLRERKGRRNHYTVITESPMRHPLVQEREVGDLLAVLVDSTAEEPAGAAPVRGTPKGPPEKAPRR